MARDDSDLGLWADDRWAIAAIGALFAVVIVARLSFYDPNDGVGLFYCIPITVAAVRFGPRGGAVAALLGFLSFVVWAVYAKHPPVGVLGFSSRITVFFVLGIVVGYFAQARDVLDRRSRRLFDLSSDLMGTVSTDGTLLTHNNAWNALADSQGAASSSYEDVFQQAVAGARLADAEGGTLREREIEVAGARRWIEWHIKDDPESPLRYVVGRDVTDRKTYANHIERLLSELQNTREAERKRLSGELHDYVLQQLIVALMHVEQSEAETGATRLREVDRLVRDATTSLRRVIDDIEPTALSHLRPAQAMEQCAVSIEDTYGIEVERSIAVHDEAGELGGIDIVLLYRLCAEALRNAAKHAGVGSVEFGAQIDRDGIDVAVRDAGIGITPAINVTNALSPAFGTGFNLLLEQLVSSGGSFSIASAPGSGVAIQFRMPRLTMPA